MALTTYAAKKLLDHILMNNTAAYTSPSVWIGLSTTDPTVSGIITGEPSGNNYSRVSLGGKFTNATTATDATTAVITFPTASGSWGTIGWFFIIDSSSGAGNVIWEDSLAVSKAVNNGDTLSFAIGNLSIAFA